MSNKTHSTGHGTGYGNLTLLMDSSLCTLETCDLSMASFLYLPTIAGNGIYAGIFGLLILGQLWLGIKHKTWGYMIAMLMGLVLEVVGYVGRIMLHDSPFDNNNFLMYLVTLTIAPALMTAAIYLCLARIIHVYGPHLSYFKPRTYTLTFCGCDLVSLVLQALGGALASTADTEADSNLGKNIMLAGLGFQVFSLILFALCCGDFALRVWKGRGTWNDRYLDLVSSRLFKSFLFGLLVACVTIFVRSVYRCVELSGGFNGTLFVSDEAVFMVLEGVMIIIACSCLTILHPAVCFQGAWHEANFNFRTSKKRHSGKAETLGSDMESQNIELTGFHAVRNNSM